MAALEKVADATLGEIAGRRERLDWRRPSSPVGPAEQRLLAPGWRAATCGSVAAVACGGRSWWRLAPVVRYATVGASQCGHGSGTLARRRTDVERVHGSSKGFARPGHAGPALSGRLSPGGVEPDQQSVRCILTRGNKDRASLLVSMTRHAEGRRSADTGHGVRACERVMCIT